MFIFLLWKRNNKNCKQYHWITNSPKVFVWTTVPHIIYNMPCMKNSLSYSSYTHLKLLCIYTAMMVIKKKINKIITQNQHYYYRKTQKNIFLWSTRFSCYIPVSWSINEVGGLPRDTRFFSSHIPFSRVITLRSTVCLLTLNHTCSLENK